MKTVIVPVRIIRNPFTDLSDAQRNRAMIEQMRKSEQPKRNPEFEDSAIMVRKPAYQHPPKNKKSSRPETYMAQTHMIFTPTEILPYPKRSH